MENVSADIANDPQLIHKKISLIMGQISAVPKNKQAMGYKFRGVDDVYLALKDKMAEHGVYTVPRIISDRSEERQSKNGSNLIYRIILIEYKFYAEDGSHVTAVVIGEGMDSGDKATNKAMSVAHKYALLQVFMVPTDEPKDPEHDSPEVLPKNANVVAQKTAAPQPPTFDPNNKQHREKIYAECLKRKIFGDHQNNLITAMTGKPFTAAELEKLIVVTNPEYPGDL